jgi:hypothetical protein
MELNSEVYRLGKIVNRNLKLNQEDKEYYLQDTYLKQRPRFFSLSKTATPEMQKLEEQINKNLNNSL